MRIGRRKTPFATESSREAKRSGKKLAATLRFWFRRKYSLPPTDPRYMAMTMAGIEEDFWAHHYFDDRVTESEEDEDFDAEEIARAMETGEWEAMIDERY